MFFSNERKKFWGCFWFFFSYFFMGCLWQFGYALRWFYTCFYLPLVVRRWSSQTQRFWWQPRDKTFPKTLSTYNVIQFSVKCPHRFIRHVHDHWESRRFANDWNKKIKKNFVDLIETRQRRGKEMFWLLFMKRSWKRFPTSSKNIFQFQSQEMLERLIKKSKLCTHQFCSKFIFIMKAKVENTDFPAWFFDNKT